MRGGEGGEEWNGFKKRVSVGREVGMEGNEK